MISKYIFIQSKQICIKKTFLLYNFLKIVLYHMNFPFDTFLVTISGLPFLFAKVRILLSVCKLKSSTMLRESC